MYKETIICIVIVCLIVGLDIITQNYTKATMISLNEVFENLREEISNENMDEVNSKINDLENKWKSAHDKLAYYIEHDELEKVDTAIVQTKSFIEFDDLPSAISELETGKFVLEHIEKKYKLNFQNIF